jgi:RNA polymerase sigma-70 factor (ECF subfamily)
VPVVPLLSHPPDGPGDKVRTLPFRGDDAALVAALLRGHPAAAAVFHDRFARKVHALLYRMLGPDSELEDTLHDVFVRALEALPSLRDPAALDSWVMGVTVRTARTRLQRRARRWWLRLASDGTTPEEVVPARDPANDEALRATYRILDRLPVDERIALVLRFAAEMTIAEAATSSGVSVATLKRRLQRAERSFVTHAEREPALEGWATGDRP